MLYLKSLLTWVATATLLVTALLLSACSAFFSVADEDAPALTTSLLAEKGAEPPEILEAPEVVAAATRAAGDYPLPPEDLGVIIPNLTALLQSGDPERLAGFVPREGLVIAPYGIGAPNRGLTGEALHQALQAMLQDAAPEVLSYDGTVPGRIGLVVSGLNDVVVTPAVGDELLVTMPSYVGWRLAPDGTWQLWLLAVDRDGLLAESMDEPPFQTDSLEPSGFTMVGDEEVQMLVGNLESLLQRGDVEALGALVAERGLVIAPYAVGLPEEGLTGTTMSRALQAMLRGAQPQVVAYDRSTEGRLGVVVTGLNDVEITPAVGEPLTITTPAELALWQTDARQWQLLVVAVDLQGLLAERLGQGSFEAWSAGSSVEQPLLPPSVPQRAITALLEGLQAGDVEGLTGVVAERGLVVAPYGVGASEEGLSGEALRQALQEVVAGSTPQIVAIDLSTEGRIGLVVSGLNPVEVTLPGARALAITSPAFLGLEQGPDGQWQWWLLAPDSMGLLADTIDQAPFQPWP